MRKLAVVAFGGNALLQVFDTYGRLFKTLSPTTKQAIVNVRDLRNGIYTIIIKSQNGTTARQFVVKH